jgi:hypothetical protein
VVAAALLLAGCWVKQLLAMEFRIGGGHRFPGDVALAIAIVVGVLLTPLHAAALAALIWIEHRGIRFFGARRRWRVTRSVAWTVCAHASYWWIVGAAVALAVMLSLPTEWPRWLPTSVQWALWGWINWVWITPAAASVFVLGLLPFETAVYFGVRRCRFANAARAAAAT